MNERIVDSDYQRLHHFISDSAWDDGPVRQAISGDLSRLFAGRAEPVGLLLDESGHRKSGKHSVGVARQYLGSIGKIDNGQVGVFAALCQGDDVGLLNSRLYLPKEWTSDPKRCEKAGIPPKQRVYKTKPELALEMVDELEGHIHYEWIGGDEVYGRSPRLRKALTAGHKRFILDTGADQLVYLTHPQPTLRPTPGGRGRKPLTYQSDQESLSVKELLTTLPPAQWKTFTYRVGTKGPLTRQVVCLDVFIWSARKAKSTEVESLRLIISRNVDGSEVKFSLTNELPQAGYNPPSLCALLYRQMQRYWVERAFQDAKDALGMTDYQVRTWRAWNHHITLTIMALHYMLEQKVLHENEIPLLSCPDIKFYLAMTLPVKARSPDRAWELIQIRHEQRLRDLIRRKSLK